MIDLEEILRLVDRHEAETGETMTELSRRVTGSKDTIRNWRRSLKEGKDSSAKFDIVQEVLQAIGVDVVLKGGGETVRTPEMALRSAMLAYGVDHKQLDLAVSIIGRFVSTTASEGQSEQNLPDDQSQPANRHRAPTP